MFSLNDLSFKPFLYIPFFIFLPFWAKYASPGLASLPMHQTHKSPSLMLVTMIGGLKHTIRISIFLFFSFLLVRKKGKKKFTRERGLIQRPLVHTDRT